MPGLRSSFGTRAARGALVGASAGVLTAAAELALRSGAASPAAFAFVAGLYGFAGAVLLATVGLGVTILDRWSDAGALWRSAYLPSSAPPEGATVASYVVSGFAAAAGIGYMASRVAHLALTRFHHRVLIAALVGSVAAGLLVPAGAAVLLLARAISRVAPFGRRIRSSFGLRPSIIGTAWSLGMVLAAASVAAFVLAVERRRMPPALQALNIGLWIPGIVLGAAVLPHLAAWRWSSRPLSVERPWRALVAISIVLLLPLAAAELAYWPTLHQLDQRPLVPLAIWTVSALVLQTRLRRTRPIFALVAAALLALALTTGRSGGVRKLSSAFASLGAPITAALHAVADLDRDGYSSILGGGDCDDLDRNIHPGAFDIPDDGIDQNCNGVQASSMKTSERRYAAVPPGVPSRPNIVLLSIDALRADHVGSYGYSRATTPNLDALAAESIRFANAWAHAPSTRYSVPAMLTGRYPSTIAVGHDWWPPNVLPSNRLLGEILKDLGYETGAILPYYYFDRAWGLDQGFDEYDVHLQSLHSQGGDPAATRGTSATPLADLDIDFIERHRDRPFFLWSHYYDTHYFFERHPEEPETDFGDDELARYDGEIRHTDIQIGRVFGALRRLGLWDRTIVIVTADHGEGFGEHRLPATQRHGYHLYANQTKVPLLIRVPGLPPRVVGNPVGHVDLLPTLLNLLRRPPSEEPQLLGGSVVGSMLGDSERRRVLQEVWYEGPTSRQAVVTESWHLIRNLVPDDTTELYRISDDPAEVKDLSGGTDPIEAELQRELARWADAMAIAARAVH